MRYCLGIALIICVLTTAMASEIAAGMTSSTRTSKKCHEFFDDFQEIWNKAKKYDYAGKPCKALYYARKAQRKMKRAPSSCTKDPDWHSIVIDRKALLSDYIYRYEQSCR